MKGSPSSPRALEIRQKQQRRQMLIAIGLGVVCIGLAVFDHLPEEEAAPPRLDGPDRITLESAQQVRISRVLTPAFSGNPGEARLVQGDDLDALRRTLLDEVGFEEGAHEHAGPWHELRVGDEATDGLCLWISTDLRWAQLENRVITRSFRVIDGTRLSSWLTAPGEDGP